MKSSGVFKKKNRQGGQPQEGHLVALSAPGRKGAIGAQWAAVRLQENSQDILADNTCDERAECASHD